MAQDSNLDASPALPALNFLVNLLSTCLKLDSTTCAKNKKCTWSQYKKNPNTGTFGVCASLPSTWGCAATW